MGHEGWSKGQHASKACMRRFATADGLQAAALTQAPDATCALLLRTRCSALLATCVRPAELSGGSWLVAELTTPY